MHHHALLIVLLMRHIRCILQGELCQANSGLVKTPVELSYWLVYLQEERKLVRVLRNISVLPRINGIKQL